MNRSSNQGKTLNISIKTVGTDVEFTTEVDLEQKQLHTEWKKAPTVTKDMQAIGINSILPVRAILKDTSQIGRSFLPQSHDGRADPTSKAKFLTPEEILEKVPEETAAQKTASFKKQAYAIMMSPIYQGLTIWWCSSNSNKEKAQAVWTMGKEQIETDTITSIGYENAISKKESDVVLNMAVLPKEKLNKSANKNGPTTIEFSSEETGFRIRFELDQEGNIREEKLFAIEFPKTFDLTRVWWSGFSVVLGFPVFTKNNEPAEPVYNYESAGFKLESGQLKSEELKKEVYQGKGYGVILSENYQSVFGYYLIEAEQDDSKAAIEVTLQDGSPIGAGATIVPGYRDPFNKIRAEVDLLVFCIPWANII
jgi:hypothetical protein